MMTWIGTTVAILLVPSLVALADYFTGAFADSATHTWWDGNEQNAGELANWGVRMNTVMNNQYGNRTDMAVAETTTHGTCATSNCTDISWNATNLPTPLAGTATCAEGLANNICDHWHVSFDNDTNGSNQQVCHEIGHTVGFDDIPNNPGGCMGGGAGALNTHEIGHIDARW